jgi:hypothetical protein
MTNFASKPKFTAMARFFYMPQVGTWGRLYNFSSEGRHAEDFLLTYLLTYLLTSLLTPRSRVLLEKLTGFASSQEIPRIYGTRNFITVLTSSLNQLVNITQHGISGGRLLAPRSTPKAGGPPLVGCPLLIIQFFYTRKIQHFGWFFNS